MYLISASWPDLAPPPASITTLNCPFLVTVASGRSSPAGPMTKLILPSSSLPCSYSSRMLAFGTVRWITRRPSPKSSTWTTPSGISTPSTCAATSETIRSPNSFEKATSSWTTDVWFTASNPPSNGISKLTLLVPGSYPNPSITS